MARAKRCYVPGLIWHITQRCHKREFLFRFARDKRAWLRWLLVARRLYGLCVLNFIITSNHVHLLLLDRRSQGSDSGGGGTGADRGAGGYGAHGAHGAHGAYGAYGAYGADLRDGDDHPIAKSLHLVEARVAQDYNKRKSRSGAFWEDRYHATAIETGEHFINCLTYIDLNMVRANVVTHPGDWPFSGYYELQQPRERFRNQIVDWRALLSLLGMTDLRQLREARAQWVGRECRSGVPERDPIWTESVAVGSKGFVEGVMNKLGAKGIGRTVTSDEGKGRYVLREEGKAYLCVFGGKNEELGPKSDPKTKLIIF